MIRNISFKEIVAFVLLTSGFFAIFDGKMHAKARSCSVVKTKKMYSLKKKKERKKVIIFSSQGGYGHVAATNALVDLLKQDYDIVVKYPFETVVSEVDWLSRLSSGKRNGEWLYNALLARGYTKAINFMVKKLSPYFFKRHSSFIKEKFCELFYHERPDLVISVVPFINGFALSAARSQKIPYCMITTDMDVTNWVAGLNVTKKDKFFASIGIDTSAARSKLYEAGIPSSKIVCTGFPLRKKFIDKNFNKQGLTKLINDWNINKNKFTIMFLMGGVGANVTYDYVKALCKSSIIEKVHPIVCVGRNNKLGKKIRRLYKREHRKNKRVSYSIIEFTEKIPQLMHLSDVLVTKPGPGSIYEALNMNIPMLVDKTRVPVFWEQECINFVVDNKIGIVVNKFKNTASIIQNLMQDKNLYDSYKKTLAQCPKANFNDGISRLLNKMFS